MPAGVDTFSKTIYRSPIASCTLPTFDAQSSCMHKLVRRFANASDDTIGAYAFFVAGCCLQGSIYSRFFVEANKKDVDTLLSATLMASCLVFVYIGGLLMGGDLKLGAGSLFCSKRSRTRSIDRTRHIRHHACELLNFGLIVGFLSERLRHLQPKSPPSSRRKKDKGRDPSIDNISVFPYALPAIDGTEDETMDIDALSKLLKIRRGRITAVGPAADNLFRVSLARPDISLTDVAAPFLEFVVEGEGDGAQALISPHGQSLRMPFMVLAELAYALTDIVTRSFFDNFQATFAIERVLLHACRGVPGDTYDRAWDVYVMGHAHTSGGHASEPIVTGGFRTRVCCKGDVAWQNRGTLNMGPEFHRGTSDTNRAVLASPPGTPGYETAFRLGCGQHGFYGLLIPNAASDDAAQKHSLPARLELADGDHEAAMIIPARVLPAMTPATDCTHVHCVNR